MPYFVHFVINYCYVVFLYQLNVTELIIIVFMYLIKKLQIIQYYTLILLSEISLKLNGNIIITRIKQCTSVVIK